jgi:phage-related minor tail protein
MNKYAPLGFASGGIASGGFRAFANGGIVTGPTLGLVGEGRYNEAVIPLPDGKSVPVDLGGAMGGQAVNNIVVNVDAKGSKVEGDEQEGKQLGRVIAAAIQQELVKQKRPGGLLA